MLHFKARSPYGICFLMCLLFASFVIARSLRPPAQVLAAAVSDDSGSSSAGIPEEMAKVFSIQDMWTDRLLQVPGVVGTATGADSDGRLHLLVLAERAGVDIPETVDGVPVKVAVSGRLSARELAGTTPIGGFRNYSVPVPIGASAANIGGVSAVGTVGCRVVDQQGRRYALSNSHILAPLGGALGSDILHLGSSADGEAGEPLGRLARSEAIDRFGDNRIDAAIARIQDDALAAATPTDGYGHPSSQTVAAELNLQVQKYGATTGLTTGRVVGLNATIHVNFGEGAARFVDQILVRGDGSGFMKAGDAGSLLVTGDDNSPVGLLFAASLGGSFAAANPIHNVLDAMRVAIDDGRSDDPPPEESDGERPAFPGAQGYGAAASGGRFGRVIEVTNLNDHGPGSLREAVDAEGPRIVVFKVGGVIPLQTELVISNPDITIAGQTAPGDGITLTLSPRCEELVPSVLSVRTRNVVLRYLRLRRGEFGGPRDSLHIYDGSSDVIADHMSITWGTDENLDIYCGVGDPIRDVTIQRSLLAAALKTDAGSAMGTLMSGLKDSDFWRRLSRIDLHHCVFAHNTHRNPRVITRGTRIVNNVIYNWSSRAASSEGEAVIDWMGNYFLRGPMSNMSDDRLLFHGTTSPDLSEIYPNASIFIAGNVAPDYGFTDPGQDNWPMLKDHRVVENGKRPDLSLELRRKTPLPDPPYPITIDVAGDALRDALLKDVGANRLVTEEGLFRIALDAIDRRILDDIAARNGPTAEELPTTAEAASRGFAPLATDAGYADEDRDGMSNLWEQRHGFDPSDGGDGTQDADKDGWTNVEEFLNGTNPRVAD